MSSFSQDKFLGSTSGSDVEELINALAEKVFYRDGSKSMEGPIGMGNNNIIGSNVIETNELAVGITPASGKVSIYALTDKKLYTKDDTGLETELAGGSGDVVGPGSSVNNRLALYSGISGKLLKESNSIIDNAGAMSGVTKLNVDDLELNSNLLTTTVGNLELDSFTNLVKIDGNAQIVGDLVVEGTTTTTHSENVYANANYLHNNTDYITTVAETGGLTVRYLPTATNDTQNGAFIAGIPGGTNPTVITSGSGTFSSSDIIAIDSSANSSNNGLYEVLTHIGTTLTVRGIGTTGCVENFTNNQFVANSTLGSTIRKVNVSIIRADTAGNWETGKGNSTGITYNTMGDVNGPGSSTDDGIALFDGVTGKIIKDSTITIDPTSTNTRWKDSSGTSLFSPSCDSNNCFFGLYAGGGFDGTIPATAYGNTAVGSRALTNSAGTNFRGNTAVGSFALVGCIGPGRYNTSIGANSMIQLTTGYSNTGVGAQSLYDIVTGIGNIAIGYDAGRDYTSSESNNILIGKGLLGTVGESDVIRIGNGQSNTFIEGIHGVTPGGTTQTVIIDSNGELGSVATAASAAYGVVQRSRTTDFTTDGNWRNIPHDTDLVTNTDLLSTAGTTLIDVNQDGLVEITFQCTCEPPDDDATTFEARFRKNNAVQPAGNIIHNMYQGSDNDKSDWSMIYRSIILDLNDGDWLGVQVRDTGGGPIILQADSIIFTAKYLGSS